MSIEGFKKYTRRSRNSASDMNRLRGQVENLSRARPPSGGGLYVRGRAGSQLVGLARPEPIWVQVTGPLASIDRLEAYTQVTDDGGVWTPPADALEGSANFPAYIPPGWPDPAEGDVVLALPSAGEDGLILLTPAAPGEGTSGDPVTVNYGPYYTFAFVGPNVGMTIATGTTLIVGGLGVWQFDVGVVFNGGLQLGVQHVTWGADQTDFTPAAGTAFLIVTLTADVTLRSLAGGKTGRPLWLHVASTGAFTLTLSEEDAAGVAANRLRLPGTAQLVMGSQDGFGLVYDGADSRWRALDDAPAGGGTGGGIEVTTDTGVPDYPGVTKLKLDTTAGFFVSEPTSGEALVGLAVLTTKGDLFTYGTANARLPVGTNGQVLTADATQATGLKWAAGAVSPLTTKGDLWGRTTADARVPVGTDGQVLTADSSQAAGLKWAAAPSAAAFSGCLAYHSADQNCGTTGVVTFDSHAFDVGGYHGTANRLTVPAGGDGYYQIAGYVSFSGGSNYVTLRRNGTDVIAFAPGVSAAGGACSAEIHAALEYLAAGDYVQLLVYGGSLTAYHNINHAPRLSIRKVG